MTMELETLNADLLARMSNVLPGDVGTLATDQHLDEAVARLRDVMALQKDAETAQKAVTQPLEQRKKSVIAWFRDNVTDKLDAAERSLKNAILAYQREQERIRMEAQRKADAAARNERERLERQAAKAAASGRVEKAEQLQDRAETVVAPVIAAAPRPTGVSSRTAYKFEVTDPNLLPREYLVPDMTRIGAVVRALKMDSNIPGVRVWGEELVAARA